MKEYEILKIGDITYTNERIIYKKNHFKEITILYDDISSFYTCIKPQLLHFRYLNLAKYITLETFDKKKYKICIGILSGFLFIGDFEEQHISMIKKMAPQAKYIKKEKLSDKIKRKLRN